MSGVFPGDFWLTQFVQGIGIWFTPIMKFFTWLGYPQAYMIIVAVIYWSIDRRLGLRLAIFLPVVASLNSILKQAIHAPRPYWLDPGIKAIHASNGFGMPSGHAQASTVWLYAASLLKKGWFWALAIGVVFLIGLSRVYLGVHFSSQVLLGWLIGSVMVILFFRFENKVLTWFLNKNLVRQLLWISGISALILIIGGVFVAINQPWEMPAHWISNSSAYFTKGNETILYSKGMDAIAGNAGAFMGTALGALLSHRQGGFDTGGRVWKRILRSVAGLLIFFVLYGLLMFITPDQSKVVLYTAWKFSGFFMISFSALFLIPLLFIRTRLISPVKGS
jgi:membrane-associated phospholipid phosphatase